MWCLEISTILNLIWNYEFYGKTFSFDFAWVHSLKFSPAAERLGVNRLYCKLNLRICKILRPENNSSMHVNVYSTEIFKRFLYVDKYGNIYIRIITSRKNGKLQKDDSIFKISFV